MVDHVVPHKGDKRLFWTRQNWAASCKSCHDLKTLSEGGFGMRAMKPPSMERSLVPFVVVCGPAGAGKSTLVESLATDRDLVLDLDAIKSRVSGLPVHQVPHEEWIGPALLERNTLLLSLCRPPVRYERAWLICGGAKHTDRRWWREVAGARVVLVKAPLEVCIRRINETRPASSRGPSAEAARKWFQTFTSDPFNDEFVTPNTSF